MKDIIIHIPFVLNNKSGVLEVCYEENNSVTKSGFDLLKSKVINPKICIGYPTMHAYFKSYDGTGYYTTNAWIQVISNCLYTNVNDDEPTKIITQVDCGEEMAKLGVPFFAYGYLAEIYDAPCNNLFEGYKKSKWVAETFLVTQPSPINDNTISYIAGFRWGYEEVDCGGKRKVSIQPIEVINISQWNKQLSMLKKDYSTWNFK